MRQIMQVGVLVVGALVLMGCGGGEPTVEVIGDGDGSISLESPAFSDGAKIPERYTCDGEDISPPLEWGDPPEGTASFALIMDDPDAPMGTWVHWVIYNIPASSRSLPEDVPAETELPDGTQQAENSWSRTDYGGPCPPRGTHGYEFKFYALNTTLDLPPGETKKADLIEAMDGHVLAKGRLVGQYGD